MKIILLKTCKDGKENQVIEVSDGYGKNFLIKNGLGVPYNPTNEHILKNKLDALAAENEAKRLEATELKYELEKLNLEFKLKHFNDAIMHSITGKKITKAIEQHGFKLPKHSLEEHLQIKSFGTSIVKIKLYKGVEAEVKILVKKDE